MEKILTISGGVNARALREHFLSNGFDIVALGDGSEPLYKSLNNLVKQNQIFLRLKE